MNTNSSNWLWNGTDFERAAGLPFSDRGLRYGMAVFETLRLRGGHPQFWEEHAARLRSAVAACRFKLPPNALKKAADLFPTNIQEGVVRVYVTAGDGGPAAPVTCSRVAVLFEERQRTLPGAYKLALATDTHIPPFGGLKTANYWRNADSLSKAQDEGDDEALLFGVHENLIGACMANVFLKLKEGWFTPSLDCGARAGIVREWVCRRMPVHEKPLSRREVETASAAFLTSSWLGVMPVEKIAGRNLDSIGPEAASLTEDWMAL